MRAIFNWYGTIPDYKDILTICAIGLEIKALEPFTDQIEILSCPAAIPERREFTIFIISGSVVKSKNMESTKLPVRKDLYELDVIAIGIVFAKFGPILVK
jgi:hypothetical protein